ncbi:hypothetical protein [Kineococcus sp. SYSU DK002]|uniref:hypothetical protein n=1 Tax=Kineococcus sp. SYSU DK002 TaxID=3383123 RepID=UPI003D7E51BD
MTTRATTVRTVLAVGALALAVAGCASPARDARDVPATPAVPPAEATASARADVAGPCPAATTPGPVSVDEGQRLSEGLTLEEATRRAQDEQQAAVLDTWLRCTRTDTYGQLRVAHEPEFHVVVALTADAGPDPLAGAPVGVLDGRVRVETTEFSEVQMRLLWGRVDAALDGCGLVTSASVELDVVRVGAGTPPDSPGVAAVQRCLDAADLGERPGREQVEVSDETASTLTAR